MEYNKNDHEIEHTHNAIVIEEENKMESEKRVTHQPKRKNKRGGFFSGMLGGFISAMLVVILFTNNLLPFGGDSTNNATSDPVVNNNAPPITTVSTNDNYDPKTIDEISKSVVGIINMKQQSIWTPTEEAGAGSGIIYKKEGDKAYIVTNNHVVSGAEEVEVDLNEGERVKAKVLGADELTDLAVLEIDSDQVEHVADLGLSTDLYVGETVFAIGNPLGMEFSSSVTKGIVSGLDRSVKVDTTGQNQQPDWVMQVIQTDAAINPGNSGGALVNSQGQVIGINSMKIAQHAVEGIGFAIPIDAALPIMEQLETNGEVARPFIGIATVSINEVPMQYRQKVILPEDSKGGMVIASVEENSPAEKAGLQQFDVITKINDADITSMLDLRKYMYSETKIGDSIKIEFYRNGSRKTVELTLVEQTI